MGFPLEGGKALLFLETGEEERGAWCFLHRRDMCGLWRTLKLSMGDREPNLNKGYCSGPNMMVRL